MTWDERFIALFDRCTTEFRAGNKDFESYYSQADLDFLRGIGCKPREFFDFVEDHCDEGTPAKETALLVASVRRDYFLNVQDRQASDKTLTRDNIPSFGEELAGMAYLPRILAKGRAKLRGELDPDLMYGCGGDRRFLGNHGHIHLADFLRALWGAGEDDAKMIDWIQNREI